MVFWGELIPLMKWSILDFYSYSLSMGVVKVEIISGSLNPWISPSPKMHTSEAS